MRRVTFLTGKSYLNARYEPLAALFNFRGSVGHGGMYTKLHGHSLPTQIETNKMVGKKQEDEWLNKQEAVVRNSVQRLTKGRVV